MKQKNKLWCLAFSLLLLLLGIWVIFGQMIWPNQDNLIFEILASGLSFSLLQIIINDPQILLKKRIISRPKPFQFWLRATQISVVGLFLHQIIWPNVYFDSVNSFEKIMKVMISIPLLLAICALSFLYLAKSKKPQPNSLPH